ncbi:hypothetical protein HanIR_Chr12g0568221 [Helianthus annuus]|nr:hypothetical protein HanIR_Chr12g0568221 [Helianthus annuus]
MSIRSRTYQKRSTQVSKSFPECLSLQPFVLDKNYSTSLQVPKKTPLNAGEPPPRRCFQKKIAKGVL